MTPAAVRAVRVTLLLAASAAVVLGLRLAGGTAPEAMRLAGPTMGTTWTVTVAEPLAPDVAAALEADVEATLARINDRMSTWLPDSELSRFNAHDGTDWFPVSAETARVVAAAQAVSQTTGGAFDVTVGPLVDLWGFGPEPIVTAPPRDAIEAARARVGWQGITVRENPPALRKATPGTRVDLSAIAKGYAVDAVAGEVAERSGHFLVEIGGELRVTGTNPAGEPWRVGVEKPSPNGRSVQRVLAVTGGAIATSGDYRNVVELDGRRYSHAIDPRTGRPVPLGVASVTVVAPTTMEADALATALMVMGPAEASAFAIDRGLAALIIIHEADDLRELATPAMTPYLGE